MKTFLLLILLFILFHMADFKIRKGDSLLINYIVYTQKFIKDIEFRKNFKKELDNIPITQVQTKYVNKLEEYNQQFEKFCELYPQLIDYETHQKDKNSEPPEYVKEGSKVKKEIRRLDKELHFMYKYLKKKQVIFSAEHQYKAEEIYQKKIRLRERLKSLIEEVNKNEK